MDRYHVRADGSIGGLHRQGGSLHVRGARKAPSISQTRPKPKSLLREDQSGRDGISRKVETTWQ